MVSRSHKPQQLRNKQRDLRDIDNHHQRDQQGGVERQQRFDELLNFNAGNGAANEQRAAYRRRQQTDAQVGDHHDAEMHRVHP
ncbi:Uncharacterised protein [Klebsiella michiganensis]|nr:Uncharacterised protein [Klebsiella michiganensis]